MEGWEAARDRVVLERRDEVLERWEAARRRVVLEGREVLERWVAARNRLVLEGRKAKRDPVQVLPFLYRLLFLTRTATIPFLPRRWQRTRYLVKGWGYVAIKRKDAHDRDARMIMEGL